MTLEIEEELDIDEVWKNTPYDTRLACTAYVFKKICEHARGGGTYRYLIYDRLGFDMDAYAVLLVNGGMDISNEFKLKKRRT